jgi:hypothetical protein
VTNTQLATSHEVNVIVCVTIAIICHVVETRSDVIPIDLDALLSACTTHLLVNKVACVPPTHACYTSAPPEWCSAQPASS